MENYMENIYIEHGYKSRIDYLKSLAENYDMDVQQVIAIANLLGPSEDFDGLVAAIEDWSY
jgi:hypothetical protein